MNALSLAIVASAVVLPLVREYCEFRREWGLGRVGSLLTLLLLFPALGVGSALALPFADTPALQWVVTVLVTVGLYSLAASALRPAATAARQRSS
jgi:hypothetical protein